ncbi:glycosyltransferase family 1 protein [Sphingobium sp.]|uniref:glycosyltransferase family 4 protein n=1 Tax=Sphingobium sp. TaxID=1912891 RepID=UPI0028BE76C0|nr:glycosyltransferase family 1 protein [Sphingobium sp.]
MNHAADLRLAASRLPASHAALTAALRRPLRVALFSGNYDCVRDGANQALNRLVAYLLHRVHAEVRIYSPTAPRKAFDSVGDIRSVRSISIPGRPEYRVALGFPQATQQDFEDFAPDIVHLSAPDLLGRQAQKHARARGIPVVASLHTRFETYLDYYRLSFLRMPVQRYLDRFYGDCVRILCPTRPIAREMGARFGPERIAIWGRGIDPACFRPALRDQDFRASLGYSTDDVVPLFFGRLVREKGLGIFAATINAIRAQGLAIRPLIIGDGPARGWLAERLPNATFMGHLSGEALGRAVASADILINPSVTEAFGNVNLEAMASGLAIVSANVPSASALIAEGRTGLLVPPRAVGAYATAVAGLLRQPHRRAALGTAAAEAAARFTWDDVLEDVARSYAHVLNVPLAMPAARAA